MVVFICSSFLNVQMVNMSSLETIQAATPLSQGFFSKVNEKRVQDLIRYTVWLKSEKTHIIGEQDPTQLHLVMRSIFLQHARNHPDELVQQIQELNELVVRYSVEYILVQIRQKVHYLNGLDKKPKPIEHSVNVSNKGEKILMNRVGFDDGTFPVGSFLMQ